MEESSTDGNTGADRDVRIHGLPRGVLYSAALTDVDEGPGWKASREPRTTVTEEKKIGANAIRQKTRARRYSPDVSRRCVWWMGAGTLPLVVAGAVVLALVASKGGGGERGGSSSGETSLAASQRPCG